MDEVCRERDAALDALYLLHLQQEDEMEEDAKTLISKRLMEAIAYIRSIPEKREIRERDYHDVIQANRLFRDELHRLEEENSRLKIQFETTRVECEEVKKEYRQMQKQWKEFHERNDDVYAEYKEEIRKRDHHISRLEEDNRRLVLLNDELKRLVDRQEQQLKKSKHG